MAKLYFVESFHIQRHTAGRKMNSLQLQVREINLFKEKSMQLGEQIMRNTRMFKMRSHIVSAVDWLHHPHTSQKNQQMIVQVY